MMIDCQKTTFNVLWTGGLDSTFRICELCCLECIIQPYYILDSLRASSSYELSAIARITAMLRSRESTKARLNDVIIVNRSQIPLFSEITGSWTVLNSKYSVGIQYEWLACYARDRDIVLEVSIEKSERSKARLAILAEGHLLRKDVRLPIYYLDKRRSTSDIKNVFGQFVFPYSLWERTKAEELEWFADHDMLHIAKETWFCHDPVIGLPCGRCHPCQDAINEDMSWRVPWGGCVLGFIRAYLFRFPKRMISYCKRFFCHVE